MAKPKVRVVFRAEKFPPFKDEVTAVFPDFKENDGRVTCYARIGQHSTCSREWYAQTRPAEMHEYAPLLAELASIYKDEELVIRKRWTR